MVRQPTRHDCLLLGHFDRAPTDGPTAYVRLSARRGENVGSVEQGIAIHGQGGDGQPERRPAGDRQSECHVLCRLCLHLLPLRQGPSLQVGRHQVEHQPVAQQDIERDGEELAQGVFAQPSLLRRHLATLWPRERGTAYRGESQAVSHQRQGQRYVLGKTARRLLVAPRGTHRHYHGGDERGGSETICR